MADEIKEVLNKLNMDEETILYSGRFNEYRTAGEWAEWLINMVGKSEAYDEMIDFYEES